VKKLIKWSTDRLNKETF